MKNLMIVCLCLLSFSLNAAEISVFAASSLTNVLSTLGKKFESKTSTKVNFTFDASSRLAHQIHEGAKADVYVSADKEWNKYLEDKRDVLKENTKELLSNGLVLISHKSNKTPFKDLKTLLRVSFKSLSLAQESVPAGKFGYQALKKAEVMEPMRGKIVNADNVRHVLAWVAKNEADYGVVFQTDAKVEPRVSVKVEIPADFHSEIVYPISLVGEMPSAEARAFFEYLQSPEARKAFEGAGFKWK